jgi:hypothetical protein
MNGKLNEFLVVNSVDWMRDGLSALNVADGCSGKGFPTPATAVEYMQNNEVFAVVIELPAAAKLGQLMTEATVGSYVQIIVDPAFSRTPIDATAISSTNRVTTLPTNCSPEDLQSALADALLQAQSIFADNAEQEA